MNNTSKLILNVILWGALVFAVLFLAKMPSISLHYSTEYMTRKYFMDLGNADDYLTLPARELTSSPRPFQFAIDTSRESRVQETFQSVAGIKDLDGFLENTGTCSFIVIQNDTILYDRYFKGCQYDSLATSFSVAKSFDSALVGIAIE